MRNVSKENKKVKKMREKESSAYIEFDPFGRHYYDDNNLTSTQYAALRMIQILLSMNFKSYSCGINIFEDD